MKVLMIMVLTLLLGACATSVRTVDCESRLVRINADDTSAAPSKPVISP